MGWLIVAFDLPVGSRKQRKAATDFRGYPGFKAFPYKEYSEVFFGSDYKVLRGGSWATRARVITPAFRNWDYPQRRQIFAGVRIAKDETK